MVQSTLLCIAIREASKFADTSPLAFSQLSRGLVFNRADTDQVMAMVDLEYLFIVNSRKYESIETIFHCWSGTVTLCGFNSVCRRQRCHDLDQIQSRRGKIAIGQRFNFQLSLQRSPVSTYWQFSSESYETQLLLAYDDCSANSTLCDPI
jgi:hypothetical protein